MKYFEFTCTRNEGRSPVAEFIAQWYLEKIGLDKQYKAKSSGSHRIAPDPNEVQSTSDDDVPFESMEKLILLGIKHDVFPSDEVDSINKWLKEKNINKLKTFFSKANTVFKDQERHFRSDSVHRLVKQHGIRGYLKAHSDQTEPDKDVVAVFAMSPNNTSKVREIYKESGLTPLIETLSAYATKDPKAKLPNAFAQGGKFYSEVIDQLFEQIPMAIDRYLSENKVK